jgi:hypothetical protein
MLGSQRSAADYRSINQGTRTDDRLYGDGVDPLRAPDRYMTVCMCVIVCATKCVCATMCVCV